MKKRELGKLGIPRGEATRSAGLAVQAALAAGSTKDDVRASIKALLQSAHGNGARNKIRE